MSAASCQPGSSNVAPPGRHRDGTPSGVLMSLSFWMCLLLAVALFALVVLSPKVVRGSRRAEEYAINQQRLVNLRQEIRYGERLAQEMQSNTGLDATVVATPRSASVLGAGEQIAVEEALRYHRRFETAPVPRMPEDTSLRVRVFQTVAGSRLLQTAGLAGSAALLIVAFAVLTDRSVIDGGGSGRPIGPHQTSRRRRLPNRYAVPAASAEQPTSETSAE